MLPQERRKEEKQFYVNDACLTKGMGILQVFRGEKTCGYSYIQLQSKENCGPHESLQNPPLMMELALVPQTPSVYLKVPCHPDAPAPQAPSRHRLQEPSHSVPTWLLSKPVVGPE